MKPTPTKNPLHTLDIKQKHALADLATANGMIEARKWAQREFTFELTEPQVIEFYNWFNSCRRLQDAFLLATNMVETAALQPDQKLIAEAASLAAQTMFEAAALTANNLPGYVQLRRLRQKDQLLALNIRKVEFVEKRAAQADQAEEALRNKKLTPEEQRAAMREIFGMTQPPA